VEKKLSASLQTAVTFLEKHGIRYAVIGGIALSQLKIGSPNSLMHLKIQKFLRNTKG
jgi:hypothetical protein